MFANPAEVTNPLHLRHDLMVEMARLEMAMESANSRNSGDSSIVQNMQKMHERIAAALQKLPLGF